MLRPNLQEFEISKNVKVGLNLNFSIKNRNEINRQLMCGAAKTI